VRRFLAAFLRRLANWLDRSQPAPARDPIKHWTPATLPTGDALANVSPATLDVPTPPYHAAEFFDRQATQWGGVPVVRGPYL
jgi:hypothetical protein